MVQAAQSAGGWFRIDDIADDTGIGRNTINAVARRLANDGYLTEVIYHGWQAARSPDH